MVQFHSETQALATLAVQDRETSRYLLFDSSFSCADGNAGRDGETELVRAFTADPGAGILRHPCYFSAPLSMMTEEGAFSIITAYLRLAAQGEKYSAFRADEYYWRDVGSRADLKRP